MEVIKNTQIFSYWFWETPENIDEPIVVIDTWAATSNLPTILAKKPKKLLLVNEQNLDKALNFYPQALLIGESYHKPAINFTASNAPSDIIKVDLRGKTVLFMTINGTRVFEKFIKKGQVLGCSFNNLKAVVDYLKKKKRLTIIMAGDNPNKVLEDQLCAQVLQDELAGKNYDWSLIQEKIARFIQDYYAWSEQKEIDSLAVVFRRSQYNIIPVGKINQEGLVEIKDLLL